MMPIEKIVSHHTGLEKSGGATRIARLLVNGLEAHGVASRLSFELGEGPDSSALLPQDFGRSLSGNSLGHIHCTANWPHLLASLVPTQRCLITLHDCELFTGGCPYPLECAGLDVSCADPCPRNFPHSAMLRHEKRQLVSKLEPILVAPSRWLARLARIHLSQPVKVIPNGIPWPERPPVRLKARQQLGIHPAVGVVLFVAHGGTGAAYKAGDTWQHLWGRIKEFLPQTLCFAVGGDTAQREGDLIFWPYVDRERLQLLMSAADVLLYPTKADNHSLVVLEAMAQALPVISYKVGGIPEQVIDQKTGFLIKPGDKESLVASAVRLLSTPTIRHELGQYAFSYGRTRFSVERMVSDYIKLYKEL